MGDGDDCDQALVFRRRVSALMEAPERGIVAGGDQSAHEEGGAHLHPPAADEAFAFPLSGLARPGGEADEGGDFAPVEAAEFGQFGDQGAGDGRPRRRARRRAGPLSSRQAGEPRAPGLVDVGLEAGELLLQRGGCRRAICFLLQGAFRSGAFGAGYARRRSSGRSGLAEVTRSRPEAWSVRRASA